MLGRDLAALLVAAASAHFDNVSRRHAGWCRWTDSGHASTKDENSTNGTYVNDDRVLPGVEVRLVDVDRVRLVSGRDWWGRVVAAEIDPSVLSRNGR